MVTELNENNGLTHLGKMLGVGGWTICPEWVGFRPSSFHVKIALPERHTAKIIPILSKNYFFHNAKIIQR